NGWVALEEVANRLPGLVISDVNMPDMDGYMLTSRLKSEPRWRGIPVLLVTSMSDPLDVIRGLQSGADGFVVKPYADDYLRERVRDVLANRAGGKGQGDETVRASQARPADERDEIVFNGQRHLVSATRRQILS